MTSPVANNKLVTPEVILRAYYQGFFPMANERGEIGFYCYEPRGVIPLDERFTVRRSVRQILKKKNFEVTFDTVPLEVLRACSRRHESPLYEQWLSDDLIHLYMRLFQMGYVHTVEVWQSKEDSKQPALVGGLYGMTIGAAFCGESMFSRVPYGSQIALVHLVERLRQRGFKLLDAQMPSEHLKQFGLYDCSQKEYLAEFHKVAGQSVAF